MQNVVSIKQPEGRYTILYGMHMVTQNPDEIPDNIQAIVLETGAHEWMDDPVSCIQKFKKHVQYKALFKKLEKDKIPVVFVDVKYKYNDTILLMLDNAFSTTEWIAGFRMLRNKKKRTPARVAVGAWLLLPFAANILRLISAFTRIGLQQTSRLKKLSHQLHPEVDFLYLTLRNAVIAEKEKYLVRQVYGQNSHIATVLGAAHVGVEDMLSMSDKKRKEFFIMVQPFLRQIVKPAQFSRVAILLYRDNKWSLDKVVLVPSLAQLVT